MRNELSESRPAQGRKRGPLTRILLERFTAFEQLDLELGPGINVFIGANGTGKTHLLKVAYAACEFNVPDTDVVGPEWHFLDKLARVFLPSRNDVQRLVRHPSEDRQAIVEVWRGGLRFRVSVSNRTRGRGSFTNLDWPGDTIKSAFIPVKEMLSHAPGFRSLYKQREIHFEETHSDIIDRAYLPPLRAQKDNSLRRLEKDLEDAIGGTVSVDGEEFFVENGDGRIEFMLLAEGLRKLGLLWLLVRNGTLPNGSVLFWDEPEANLNPGLVTVVVDVLLQLQRAGVQILLATHDYAVLKELELLTEESDEVCFHTLYRDSEGELSCESATRPFELRHSPIAEAFTSLYDREIERSLGRSR